MMTKSAELLAMRLKINEARRPAYKSLWISCHRDLSLDQFSLKAERLQPICKKCDFEKVKGWWRKHPAKYRAQKRRWEKGRYRRFK
jgi:hypothetical protein